MQSIESSTRRRGLRLTNVVLLVVVIAFIVAVIFAANQNDIVGWMVVVISGGWLILSTVSLFMVRRGARAVHKTAQNLGSNLAASSAGGNVVDATDPMRDTKVDHSLKIVEVQKRVVTEELAKGDDADMAMIDRALDTIEMTASNARDMLNPDRGKSSKSDPNNGPGTITGDVIN
ncbi:hypothetical protein GCM10009720_01580 [Yaniella flava]|uniref:Uncharacterized protein n=1 Tax=Yaniella flava TaxID=287930 RepID=A0ABP5FFI4_9MICC